VIEIRLDELMKKLGRSYYWLAKQSGVSHNTLWRLKKGKTKGITFDTLESICRVLRCSPGDLLVITNVKKKGR
jgi:putative transcriptional regulator